MKTLTLILLAFALVANSQLNELRLVGQYYGEAAEDHFGLATTFGDFDNDGCEEMLIGASGWDDYGKNYFYDWDGSWPTDPAFTFQGMIEGYSYDDVDMNLGDINGDGIDDFGLVDYVFNFVDPSRLDIFYGATDLDTLPDWSMWSDGPIHNFGTSLDSCGDVNGDGGNDFIMHILDPSDEFRGFQIYFGGNVLDTIPDWEYPSDYFDCSGLGDVNGDSFGDVMLLSFAGGPPLLFFGGSPMDTIPDLVFYNFAAGGVGGGVGDVNGDGYNDFCMPMRFPDSTLSRDALYFGGPDVDNTPDVLLLNIFGVIYPSLRSIASGDFNGDGFSDIVTTPGLPGTNSVHVYLGSAWFNPSPDVYINESVMHDFGSTISSGDLNGDGCDELLITHGDYPWFNQGMCDLYTGPEEWIDFGAGVEPGKLPHTPGWYKLDQNYPNPFNATTTIHFELGKASIISLVIYDLQGEKVKELIKPKEMIPGGYNVSWTGKNKVEQPVSSGIYLLELRVDDYREVRKMVLVR
ncbi:hypothetical protein CEE37_06985 [candidate division LCP-89 bacterium B3_LCP]|uniref:Secretion system C-terminal sorting domain-containing protein n=1 Tax=candidate division LCP-89 bacterium B3_LCP TaxID=2012998 RepID=A0A532V0N7_UNCL8|nr:MAG: hypothetical protein CEE37_06985 [candidate division LCP-89 bacterium B3_LCP]